MHLIFLPDLLYFHYIVYIVWRPLVFLSKLVTFFPCHFSIDRRQNILALADLLAALWMRILQLLEQMVQRVDSLQTPD